jgi:hypothetical protein
MPFREAFKGLLLAKVIFGTEGICILRHVLFYTPTGEQDLEQPLIECKKLILVMFNPLGQVTSPLLGSPVVGLPSFSLWIWRGVFCSVSSAHDGTDLLRLNLWWW